MSLNSKLFKLKSTSTQDVILRAFLKGELESLNEELQLVFRRWEQANDLIRNKRIKEKNIVAFLREAYGISRSQAYQDIQEAKIFFGTAGREQVEYKRGLYVEWLEELYKLARQSDDYKTAITAIDKASELLGLKTKSPDLPNYEDIQPFIPTLTYDPTMISSPASKTNITDLREAWMKKKMQQNIIQDAEIDDGTE